MQQNVPDNLAWAVVYTRSRAEKQLHDLIQEQGIECYLPLRRVLKQWSDRKKWVEEPLFSSYLFVRISEKEKFKVLNTPGAVRYITFEGRIARVREEEINWIKRLTAYEPELEAVAGHIEKGSPVSIKEGSLMGLQGELISYRSSRRVVVRVESIGQSIVVSIPFGCIEPLKPLLVAVKAQ
jgi:transcription antitermination factor NusG